MSQISFAFCGLARQDMAMVGLFPLDLSALENRESLSRSTVALHFGHIGTPFRRPDVVGRSQQY